MRQTGGPPEAVSLVEGQLYAQYPEAQLSLVDEVCAWDVLDHFSADDASAVFVPGGLTRGSWGELVERNEPGNVATEAPILVVHSAADEFVALDRSERLVERMCEAGQVVERRVYEPGASHGDALPVAIDDALRWFEQRLAGDAPESTCPDS